MSAEAGGEGRRSNRPGNSQAKGPRSGDELLESETALAVSTEGVTLALLSLEVGRGNLSGPIQRGRAHEGVDSCIGTEMTIASDILCRTPLYALHLELGGKMVPFAGYEMPVQYPAGILKEHLHTREKAGLFDVSHMGQAFLSGGTSALERVTPADVAGLKEGMQRYGLLLTDAGTIKDDFMFSRLTGESDLYLVVNADTKDGDFAYIAEQLTGAATVTPRPDRALLALQGPMAV